MSPKYLLTALCLTSLPAAAVSDPLVCENTLGTRLYQEAQDAIELDDPNTIQLEAGRVEAQLGERPTTEITDGILLRRGDKLAGADSARFDPDTRSMFLDGNVRFQDPGTEITSDSAHFEYDTGRVGFTGAEFSLGSSNARGAADRLLISQDGLLQLDAVSYTTCPPESEDWLLQANDIDLDTRSGVGTARGVKLRFKNVPVLWAPYLSFPISDARKSGLLPPEIGSTSRSGNEIIVPFYWNIAPNYDATITPRLLTDRGLQLLTEFRYLTEIHEGQVNAEYLNDDSPGRGRSLFRIRGSPHALARQDSQRVAVPRSFGQPVFRRPG